MSALFEPITLRNLTIPNRVWMSPMCQYSAAHDGPDAGVPHDWHLTHLASRAVGGVGLAMVEITAVRPEGRITPGDLGLWNDRQRDAFRVITAMLESHGVVPGIQIGHAGRKASTRAPWEDKGSPLRPDEGGWQTVGPSAVPFGSFPTPTELSRDEIAQVVADFRAAAQRALDAGFKVIEVHGAHGYLIHSFLSPHSNQRTDEYGGSFENRTRFALEVVDAVREVWPAELPVLFRVSATDWLSENEADEREGWTGEDTVRLAKELQAHGVDLLDTSSGGIAPDARIPVGPGYQTPFATRVRERVGLPVGTVGLVTRPEQAEEIIASGQADVVLLGRELLRDPYWPRRAALALDGDAGWPNQYAWAI
ncbi:NADH:flavin oxidoreductase/NADH oxidase [Streptoalloteichus hindustanus]|uniref:2,4-dienoyl-CoA reductase n=1 Tax=Streptoalloteichus hindustanus TaxID=2017 RepID=A0A1M5GEF8_STRHI|nr:NADH:flavin oxidoreductase/NADH oxidase [Streptoalloteichus hindustanus]SHG02117.1 2,4-dienoyl-CoA reductase [Streptoalloteichus hindustanus]